MTESGHELRENNERIVKLMSILKKQRDEMHYLIQKQEQEKQKIQTEIEKLSFKLTLLTKSLSQRIQARTNYDKTIKEIEERYQGLVDESGKLLSNINKEVQVLEEIMDKKTGTVEPALQTSTKQMEEIGKENELVIEEKFSDSVKSEEKPVTGELIRTEQDRRSRRSEEDRRSGKMEENRRNSKAEDRRSDTSEEKKSNRSGEDRRSSRSEEDRRNNKTEEDRRGSKAEEDRRSGASEEKKSNRSGEDRGSSRSEEDRRNNKTKEDRRGSKAEEDRRSGASEEKKSNKSEDERRSGKSSDERKGSKSSSIKSEERKTSVNKQDPVNNQTNPGESSIDSSKIDQLIVKKVDIRSLSGNSIVSDLNPSYDDKEPMKSISDTERNESSDIDSDEVFLHRRHRSSKCSTDDSSRRRKSSSDKYSIKDKMLDDEVQSFREAYGRQHAAPSQGPFRRNNM